MPISMHIGCSGTSQHLWQVQVGNVNVDKAGSQGESGSLHILFWSFKSHCKDKEKGEFSFHVLPNIGPWISMLNGDFVFPEAGDT